MVSGGDVAVETWWIDRKMTVICVLDICYLRTTNVWFVREHCKVLETLKTKFLSATNCEDEA